jgi:septin 7
LKTDSSLHSNCWDPILEYIEDQFDDFLEAETRVTRIEVPSSQI